jgi:hypothetical protein
LIQEFKRAAAKILYRRMEINGVHGYDRRDLALETSLGTAKASVEREIWIYGRLEFHGAIKLQQPVTVEMRRDGGAGAVLRDADTNLLPCPVRVVIRAVAGSARRARQCGEQFGEVADGLADQITLSLSRNESIVRGSFGIFASSIARARYSAVMG